jgi:hypothetical protein
MVEEDLILDLELTRPKRSKFQWILFIVIVVWVLTNLFLVAIYNVHASGALITTNQSDIIPRTPFMDNCWRYLLATNIIGILSMYLIKQKILS